MAVLPTPEGLKDHRGQLKCQKIILLLLVSYLILYFISVYSELVFVLWSLSVCKISLLHISAVFDCTVSVSQPLGCWWIRTTCDWLRGRKGGPTGWWSNARTGTFESESWSTCWRICSCYAPVMSSWTVSLPPNTHDLWPRGINVNATVHKLAAVQPRCLWDGPRWTGVN